MDLLQAPFNVLDHRLETSGWMQRLHDSGVELHVRSVFLQGLLLMAPNLRPRKFKRWNKIWDEWHDWLEQNETSALKTCLHYALSRPQIKHVLVGVDNQMQLQEILKCLDDRELIPPMSFSSEDPELLNPSKWNLL
jgi:aryl-alcohol dehydrogenase-like predicted oxidoreductase